MKERELLKKILATGWLNNTIYCREVEKLLAQPETEQEPVVWQVIGIAGFMYLYNKPIDQVYLTHTVNALYTAPPKREPLSGATINYYLERLGSSFKWDDGFEAGVKWAEKAHGITGGGE